MPVSWSHDDHNRLTCILWLIKRILLSSLKSGVNIKSGEIFPATFPDKGPELPLRSARHFTGCHEASGCKSHFLAILTLTRCHKDRLQLFFYCKHSYKLEIGFDVSVCLCFFRCALSCCFCCQAASTFSSSTLACNLS